MNLRCATQWTLPCIAVSTLATAQTVTWSLDTGVERSDNIARTAIDEIHETTALAGLTLGIDTQSPKLDAEISANLEYREYLNRSYDDEVLGGLDGTVYYRFIPEHFAWSIEDNFAQLAVDGLAVDTPDNRQNVNYFTSGPDVILPFGARTALQLSARFSDVAYDVTLEDNQSLEGSLALMRAVSRATTVSLVGSRNEIRYDRPDLYPDNDVTKGFLRSSVQGRRASLTADIGYSKVEQPLQEPREGPLVSLETTLQVGARSTLGFRAGTEPSTTADVVRRDQDATGIEVGSEDAIATSDVFKSDYAYLSWDTDAPRGSFTAGVNASRETHDLDATLDRETYGAVVRIVRLLSRRVEAQIAGEYSKDVFLSSDVRTSETTASVGLLWRISARASASVRFDHIIGSSNNGSIDFVENLAYVGFSVARTSKR